MHDDEAVGSTNVIYRPGCPLPGRTKEELQVRPIAFTGLYWRNSGRVLVLLDTRRPRTPKGRVIPVLTSNARLNQYGNFSGGQGRIKKFVQAEGCLPRYA